MLYYIYKGCDTVDKKYIQVKYNIVVILVFMIFLFTLCFVLYSKVNRDNIDINTSIELSDGNDVISQNLQGIIPTSDKINRNIRTAYQTNVTTYRNIDNDIFLIKAYKLASNYSYKDMYGILKKLYGNNLFIINNSFNVNGTDVCNYDSLAKVYNCTTKEYKGITYSTFRKIDSVNISNDDYFLTENVVFYSKDNTDEEIKYSIYSDATYNEAIVKFTSKDFSDKDMTIDKYIEDNYMDNSNIYRSKFILIKNSYQWINTERLK